MTLIPTPLRLLLVEDQRQDAEFTCAALQAAGYSLAVTRVETEADFSAALDAQPDLVLCDHVLPEFGSERALKLFKARDLDIPFIIVSGQLGEDLAVQTMLLGADDYLLKDRLARLGPAVTAALERRDMRREAKRAADERRESDERFRATFEQAAVGIAHSSIDSRFLLVNQKFCEVTGYTREELLRMSTTDLIHPDERDLGMHKKLLVENNAQTYSAERRYVRRDGAVIWVNSTVSLVRDAAGAPLYLVRVIEDVSERRHAQQRVALLQAATFAIGDAEDLDTALHRVLQEICESTGWTYGQAWLPDAGCQWLESRAAWHDGSTQVELFHQEAPRLSLTSDSALAARVFHDQQPLWQPDLGQVVFHRRDSALSAGFKSWAGIPVLADGKTVAVLVFFMRGNQGYDAGLFDLVTVVAAQLGMVFQRRVAEASVRESEERFRQLAGNIPQVFWMTDATQSSITYMSQGFERLTGRQIPLSGSPVVDLLSVVHDEDRARVRREWQSGGALGQYDIEYRMVHVDGTERWVHDRAFPVRDAQGAVQRIAGITDDITERKRAQEQLLHLAHYDQLTGLPNRILFYDRLKQALAHARRNSLISAVLFIDLDRFKNVNDTLGHARGDKLLRTVSERLALCVRSGDTVGRLGGVEFAIILSELSATGDARMVAQNFLTAIAEPHVIDGKEVHITASIGIAVYPSDSDNVDTLMRDADAAMYCAKAAGRNAYRYYTAEMNKRALEKMQLETQLRRALERGEFLLHYQPKADIATGEITGVEALLRWQPVDGALVSPDRFIPLLEETGLIVPVGDWVLKTACAQLKSWKDARVPSVPIAVNLSARQFHQQDLGAVIKRHLSENGVAPRLLELEITESAAMHNPEASIAMLHDLRALGVRLAIDDFGTGYSSLSYLKRLPVDTVKIDRSFVTDLATNPDDASIAQAVIKMAHTLSLKVVAEGVETAAQLSFLSSHGCDQMQGYYFSRPLPEAEITELLTQNRQLQRPESHGDEGERTLLLLDDEENVLASLKRLLRRDRYKILTATNAQTAFEILANHRVGVIVSDQRMPGMTGVEFLRRVKELYPGSVRMVLSGYTDLDSVTDAINQGAIYRFLTKPWDDSLLRAHIAEAFRRYVAVRDAELRQQQSSATVEELMRANRMLKMVIEQRSAGVPPGAAGDAEPALEGNTP